MQQFLRIGNDRRNDLAVGHATLDDPGDDIRVEEEARLVYPLVGDEDFVLA